MFERFRLSPPCRRTFRCSCLWLAFALFAFAPGCSKKKRSAEQVQLRSNFLVVAQEQHASWIRNFNPFLAPSSVRWPTPSGIYEPMLIWNAVKGKYVPWLASAHRFSDDNRTLTFTVRTGVNWSDGKPFGAKDIAFTFNLMKRHPALDLRAVWKYLESVEAKGSSEVVFKFSRVYTPGLFRIAHQPIVPEHVWQTVPDPVTFTNPNPVATGPFTEVKTFRNQVYELAKNPNYWQAGKPYIAGLRFPAYPSNDQSNLALKNGEVDWSGKFVPEIEKVYVSADPEHHRYWFPNMGGTHNVYANLARPPLDDVRVRKALSMAINRARIVKVALHDYTKPAKAHGLSETYRRWADKEVAEDDWLTFDLEKAKTVLDAAGYRPGPDGVRVTPTGKRLSFSFNVVTGWSDWVTVVQLIIADLKPLGVEAKMKMSSFSAWYDSLQKGEFDLSMGWAEEGPTPYMYYRFVMAGSAKKSVGDLAIMNWQRFQNDEVDRALRAFEQTRDPKQQRELSRQLQRLYSKHAPTIPLYPSPSWGICNTKRFVNFPSKENAYARLSPFSPPEYLLVLTNVKPRRAAELGAPVQ